MCEGIITLLFAREFELVNRVLSTHAHGVLVERIKQSIQLHVILHLCSAKLDTSARVHKVWRI